MSLFLLSYMKIVCWNVQGAKKSQLRLEVRFINRTIKLDILILLETMVNDQNADSIIRNLGFSHYNMIPAKNIVAEFGVCGMP